MGILLRLWWGMVDLLTEPQTGTCMGRVVSVRSETQCRRKRPESGRQTEAQSQSTSSLQVEEGER